MKFASFEHNNKITYGAIKEQNGKVLLSDIGSEYGFDLRYWIETDQMDKLKEIAASQKATIAESEIKYMPPILTGQKIACIGVNYADRNAEYKDNTDLPQYPSLFLRYLDSFTGHHQNLVRPPESHQLDYEGEIVIIIGKGGRRILKENALEHIAGLTLILLCHIRNCHIDF